MAEGTKATITIHDVLLGRGRRVEAWEGNVRFRQLVGERCLPYHISNDPKRREAIAREVLFLIKDEDGRFLRCSQSDDRATATLQLRPTSWTEIPPKDALTKIRQALRDAGAKAMASGNGTFALKKKNRKTTEPAQKKIRRTNSSSVEVRGAGTFGHLEPGEVFKHKQDDVDAATPQAQSVNLCFKPVSPFRAPLLPQDQGLYFKQKSALVQLCQSSVQDGVGPPLTSLRRHVNVLENNLSRGLLAPAQHGAFPYSYASGGGERDSDTLEGQQQPYQDAARASAMSNETTNSPQLLGLAQSAGGGVAAGWDVFTAAEIQTIDEALKLAEECDDLAGLDELEGVQDGSSCEH